MQNQDWLLKNLIECFNDNKKAIPFIKEKLQIINGTLYKYCPIYENEDIQFSIMNLENDNIYLSSISNFNDPFDSLCSFSIEDFARRILENKLNQIPELSKVDGVQTAIPIISELFIKNNKISKGNSFLVNYLVKCVKRFPELLKSTELFQQKFLQILFEDFSNGEIAIEDMENLSKIQGENILHDFFIAILNDKDAVKTIDNSIDENNLELAQKFINGEIPELELIRDNFHSTLDEQKPVIKNAIGDIYKTIDKAILVSCFCSSVDNALMWAHYANKHKGFCVEYNLSKSTNFELLLNLNPVIYSDNRAMLPQNMFYIDEDDQIQVATTNQSTAELICALLTKSNVWEYEKEWRLILPFKNTTNRLYKMDCITKVILGCNIESQYEKQIRDICIEKGYKLSKMELDTNHYSLNQVSLL